MAKSIIKALCISAGLAFSGLSVTTAYTYANPTVGGAAMRTSKNIIENAVNSPIHKTLVAAVKAAGLVGTLEGSGPFTVFAPTDSAFKKLPAGTVAMLLKPENKAKLVKVLTAHVVAGKISAGQMLAKAKANGGKYKMKTVSGDTLTAIPSGKGVSIVDENGGVASITIADVNQSNGVIQVVNKVLLPK